MLIRPGSEIILSLIPVWLNLPPAGPSEELSQRWPVRWVGRKAANQDHH